MRIALFFCVLLCGCLDYKIAVETKVTPDGIQRTITIKEPGRKKPWDRFEKPEAPYAVEGSDEKGYRGTAMFELGTHRSGLRRLMSEREEDTPQPVVAEGEVSVAAEDFFIGTLYRYDESIANGADPARFRKELPLWLDRGLRIVTETLRLRMPEIDFDPAEKHAREKVLPRVERAAIAIHLHATSLLRDDRVHRYGEDAHPWLATQQMQAILAELATVGFKRRGPPPDDADKYFKSDEWELGGALVDECLAQVKGLTQEQRTKLRDDLLKGDLEDLFELAAKKLFPDKKKLERELLGFVRSVTGGYMEIFDSCDLKFSVTLPGQILQTNGRIVGSTLVWEFSEDQLGLSPPHLSAISFLPAKGVEGRKWDLVQLAGVREVLIGLSAEERAAAKALVERANEAGWGDSLLAAARIEGENVAKVIRRLNELRQSAQ